MRKIEREGVKEGDRQRKRHKYEYPVIGNEINNIQDFKYVY